MIELRGISKHFPSNGVTALVNAGITLRAGEIHALLGENGTGKSTLMHILAGYLTPSSGTIFVEGKKRHFSAPASALAFGIGMVRQHPGFIKGFKVWEDCILGAEKEKRGGAFTAKLRGVFLDPGASRKRVEELSDEWNFDLPLDRDAESLTVSQRQKAAILALLLRDVKWFIFDEPTAVLTPGETETLFRLFRRLRNEGRGIILITHKLDEALELSDRVTVIRRGITREPFTAEGLSAESLKKAIFGPGETDAPAAEAAALPGEQKPGAFSSKEAEFLPPVLEISGLVLEPPGLPYLWNVNLRLKRGRILGIAGVRDSGLETLELAIPGLLYHPEKIEGSIVLNGRDITGKGARAFRDAGGAYLGANRLGSNLAPGLPLEESLIIHAFRRAAKRLPFFLDSRYLDSWCENIMKRAGIERRVSDRPDSFSGGMLQRILLAREFAEEASLVVLAEAGSGLDLARRSKLEDDLKALSRSGASALLFSTDVEELISAADEIMVLRNGSFTAHFVLRASPEKNAGETVLPAAEARKMINAAMTGNADYSAPSGKRAVSPAGV